MAILAQSGQILRAKSSWHPKWMLTQMLRRSGNMRQAKRLGSLKTFGSGRSAFEVSLLEPWTISMHMPWPLLGSRARPAASYTA